jgi:hypothetical protein
VDRDNPTQVAGIIGMDLTNHFLAEEPPWHNAGFA